jgi:hypothetical protein
MKTQDGIATSSIGARALWGGVASRIVAPPAGTRNVLNDEANLVTR